MLYTLEERDRARWSIPQPGDTMLHRSPFKAPPGLPEEAQAEILAIYAEAKSKGMHVDHVVARNGVLPNGERVEGMHVPWNLALLSREDNSSKGNRVSYEDWIAYQNACVGRLGGATA